MQYIIDYILDGSKYPYLIYIFYNIWILLLKLFFMIIVIWVTIIPLFIFLFYIIWKLFSILWWKYNFFEKISRNLRWSLDPNDDIIPGLLFISFLLWLVFLWIQWLLNSTIEYNLWWWWIIFVFTTIYLIIKWKGSINKNSEDYYSIDKVYQDEFKKETDEKYRQELEENRKLEIHNRRIKLIPEQYIGQFLNHAERKFHKRDKYGNIDNKMALDKEIIEYLEMIAKQQEHTDQLRAIDALSRWNNYPRLNEDYTWLKNYLKDKFNAYIAEKNKKSQQWEINIESMSGVEFERYLAKIFEDAGYTIEFTPESGDQWADLIASKWTDKLVIQAKRYKASVWNKAVQEVIWAIRYYNGTEWWVITNSIFTSSARELARVNNIWLIDGSGLMELSKSI